jgi:steroid delta-isomerase-like uncharacterized protein
MRGTIAGARAACNMARTGVEVAPIGEVAMGDRTKALARFMEEVWNEGRADAVDRYLAPAYTIHHDPHDPWHGKTLTHEEFKHRLASARAPFPDQRFTIVQSAEEDDRVAICWTWAATHTGDIPGFAATGRTITMTGATFYFFEAEDRLTGHWQAVDRLGVMMQLRG